MNDCTLKKFIPHCRSLLVLVMLKLGYTETGLEDVAAFQILKILNHLLLVLLFQLSSPFQEYIKYLDKARGRAALQPIAN